VCDSCPSVDIIALIAGVFRALVAREVAALRAGVPVHEVAPPLAVQWGLRFTGTSMQEE
jgi:carboxylate-amine ligase